MSVNTSQTNIVGKGAATADGPGPDVMAASTLDGNNVLSSDGDDVGKIKEIMLDVASGRHRVCGSLERRLPRNRRQTTGDSLERFDA